MNIPATKTLAAVGGMLVVIIGLLVWMFYPSPTIAPPPTPCENPPRVTAVIAITGTEFVFSPSGVSVLRCQNVRLSFHNTGTDSHRLKIDNLLDTGLVHPGVTRTVEFRAPERAGTYPFYDPTSNYRQIGMEGRLVVQ